MKRTAISWIVVGFIMTGCTERQGPPAPVQGRNSTMPDSSFSRTILPIIVKPGDSVGSLAKRYHIQPQDIIALNHLKAPYHILIGQRLKIPYFVKNKGNDSRPSAHMNHSKPVPTPSTFPSSSPRPGQVTPLFPERSKSTFDSSASNKPVTLLKDSPLKDKSTPVSTGPVLTSTESPKKVVQKDDQSERTNTKSADDKVDIEDKSQDKAQGKMQIKLAPTPVSTDTSAGALTDDSTADKNAASSTDKKSHEQFAWPLRGRILKSFGKHETGFQNDGINIEAAEGDKISAADEGVVAYVGNELQGFGNLIMIKHKNGWMSAYAHCSETLVKRGDKVKRGSTIARVGHTGSVRAPQLHFELRKKTKAVDPIHYLE